MRRTLNPLWMRCLQPHQRARASAVAHKVRFPDSMSKHYGNGTTRRSGTLQIENARLLSRVAAEPIASGAARFERPKRREGGVVGRRRLSACAELTQEPVESGGGCSRQVGALRLSSGASTRL